MGLEISREKAIANLTNLAKLVSNGNNKGNVHVGLMTTTDGRTRVVKFDAGKKLTEDMKKSCEELRKKISGWMEAAKDDEKWGKFNGQLTHQLLFNLGKTSDNDLTSAHFLQSVLENAFTVDEREKFVDASFRGGKPLSFKTVKNALATNEKFTYRRQDTSERGRQIAQAVGQRSKISNFFHAIGRGIMKATHAIKAFFTRQTRTKEWSETVDNYKDLFGKSANSTAEVLKWKLPALSDEEETVAFDAHVVASSCGLKGKIDIRPFKMGEKLFPEGSPSISDIKQNPELQDCWFLSSLAAVLRSQGPQYIKDLIDTKSEPGSALVRLGEHRYQVPLADVLADGKPVVSNSKPWVRILEQAMAMHFSVRQKALHKNEAPNAKSVRMSYRSSQEGIDALLGKNSDIRYQIGHAGLQRISSLAYLNKFFADGTRPVVLGSKAGLSGTAASLGTGISPGHACALLKIDEANHHVTVLDPYGRVRQISEGDLLKHFDIICVSSDTWDKHHAGGVKADVASVDNKVEQQVQNADESKSFDVGGDSWEFMS